MTLPELYRTQVQHIQNSPKFQPHLGEVFQPVPFPGYSVITPPWVDESDNHEFYGQLQAFQEQIGQKLASSLFIPLPPDSFHMTLADLIWDSAYRHADENPDFQPQLRDRIAEIFDHCRQQQPVTEPIYWQVIGLIVMPRAFAVGLAPKNEQSYRQILELRRAIYQNPALIALGIEQQYHLTAHITLGYFGDVSAVKDRDQLSQILAELNQQLVVNSSANPLWVRRAELRKFDDMTRYYRESDWPVLQF
jgi:hypothetical protein